MPLHWLMLGIGVVQALGGGWLELDAQRCSTASTIAWLAAAWSAALVVAFELAHGPLRWTRTALARTRALMLLALLLRWPGVLDHFGSASGLWSRYTSGLGALETLVLIALGCGCCAA